MTVDPLIGQTLADRYRIIRTLGEGGMGRVYLGEHLRMGRMSAIKVMSPSLAATQDAVNRFNREAANASRINHPHVAQIYDFGETAEGVLYLAMEFVDGKTLSALLESEGPLSLQRTAALTKQISDALTAAHTLGIVHRDLKPDNILVGRDVGGDDFAKVVDFGIAKSVRAGGQTVTTTGISIGTPAYMSPEQLAGGELDHRSDIYSLGLVVYAMLTGKQPFPEPSSKEALVQRLTARPRPLAEIAPGTPWPSRLQSALDRALSPDVQDRYEKVQDFGWAVVAASTVDAASDARTRRMTPLVTKQQAEPPAVSSGSRGLVAGVGAFVALGAAALALWMSARSGNESRTAQEPRVAAAAADSAAPDSQPTHQRVDSAPASRVATRDTAAPRTAPPAGRGARSGSGTTASAPRVPDAPRDTAPSIPPLPVAVPRQVPDSIRERIARMRREGTAPVGRHSWLRASGDSSPVPLSAPSPAAAEAREIVGHLNRARRAFDEQKVMQALPELRTAYEEYAVFLVLHPEAQEVRMMTQQFRGAMGQVMNACRTASDSSSRSGGMPLPCGNIERMMNSALREGPLQGPRGGRRPERAPSP